MGLKNCCKCMCCPCFHAKFKPNENIPLQLLPKPREADIPGGIPFITVRDNPDVLVIRNIDPCISDNGEAHHTDKFDLMSRRIQPQLVVRRGQPFSLIIFFNRPYNKTKDIISFIFSVEDEEQPSFGKGTLVGVPLLKNTDNTYPWNVMLQSVDDNYIKVQVFTSPDCIVAKWKMDIDTKLKDGGAYCYELETAIYILFNPWCRQDQVFMKDADMRKEAVLADVGLIYRGTFNRIQPCIWKYQQFEAQILDCSLYLIKNIGKIHANFRSDPVYISRALSAAVNSVDDNGVVMGNWGEDFSGGTPPTKWIGSMEILQQYYKKKKPVKYGQCWVFSGVLTTICRALGIPCRTVTNYKSAHDTQSSLTVDCFMDNDGKVVEKLNSDSVWNFHVWNEVWMQRPDLGSRYGGWQVIDATPQEQSEDVYRVGPTSVMAIKYGEVKRPYDTGFLFAEVNADKVFWRYTGETEPLKLLGKDIHAVGKLIITKSAHNWTYENITQSYKHPESAIEERATMFKALRQSENMFARYYLNDDFNDIEFKLEAVEDKKIGDEFVVTFVMKNIHKSTAFTVTLIVNIDAVTYTGKIGSSIKQGKSTVALEPGTLHEIRMGTSYKDYSNKISDQAAFNVSCLATVHDTKFEYYTQEEFRLRKPDIKIVFTSQPKLNQEVNVNLFLDNPLPTVLKKGEFTIDAPGVPKKIILKAKKTIEPGGNAVAQFKFTPTITGSQTIAAKFISKELNDVDGYVNFYVLPQTGLDNGNNIDSD